MRKTFLLLFMVFMSLGLTGCNSQKTRIDGMDIVYEADETMSETNSGEIVDNDIVIYVALTSGMLTPSVSSLKKSGSTLYVVVDAISKSSIQTDDMAYWKITIKSNNTYVKDIENVSVRVRNKWII